LDHAPAAFMGCPGRAGAAAFRRGSGERLRIARSKPSARVECVGATHKRHL